MGTKALPRLGEVELIFAEILVPIRPYESVEIIDGHIILPIAIQPQYYIYRSISVFRQDHSVSRNGRLGWTGVVVAQITLAVMARSCLRITSRL